MAELNLVPEFTPEETVGSEMPVITGAGVKEEVPLKEPPVEEIPPASPAEKEPSDGGETPKADDADLLSEKEREEKAREIQGIEAEKARLLTEVQELRGERRQLKQSEADKLQSEIDELKDLDPQDVSAIERIIRAKGYLTKGEAGQIRYDDAKDSAIDKFLTKYPEYKKENDPNDIRWEAIQREMYRYVQPNNPSEFFNLLERSHKFLAETIPSDPNRPAQKQRVEVASMGGGGVQRSSSQKSLPAHMEQYYRDGGWSEEDITEIKKNYQE